MAIALAHTAVRWERCTCPRRKAHPLRGFGSKRQQPAAFAANLQLNAHVPFLFVDFWMNALRALAKNLIAQA
jgi:hypothetical protein